jgi:hypothetical protein
MILGMSTATFTALHVVISLVAIAAGLVVVAAMLQGNHRPDWTLFFLTTSLLTSATGFMFPVSSTSPAQIVGAISLVALAVAVTALYPLKLKGAWRAAYIIGALVTLYLNAFVAVVQAFQKITPLARLAPTQSELPFVVAQFVVLAAAIAATILAMRRFHAAAQ